MFYVLWRFGNVQNDLVQSAAARVTMLLNTGLQASEEGSQASKLGPLKPANRALKPVGPWLRELVHWWGCKQTYREQ